MKLDLLLDPTAHAISTRRQIRQVVLDEMYPAQLPMTSVDSFGWRTDRKAAEYVLYVQFVEVPLFVDVPVVSKLISALLVSKRHDVTVEWGRDGETMFLVLRQPLR